MDKELLSCDMDDGRAICCMDTDIYGICYSNGCCMEFIDVF